MVTCGGAQVALQQRLILRPGNKQFIKNLNREGGQFSVVARGHFSVGISNDYTSSAVTTTANGTPSVSKCFCPHLTLSASLVRSFIKSLVPLVSRTR